MPSVKQQRAWLDSARARLDGTTGLQRVNIVKRICDLEAALDVALAIRQPVEPDEEPEERLPVDLAELMAAAATAIGGAEGPVAGCTGLLAEQLPSDFEPHILKALVAQAFEWHPHDPVDDERLDDDFWLLVAGYHLARRLLGDAAPKRGWVDEHDDYDSAWAEETLGHRLAVTIWDDPATEIAFFAAFYSVPLGQREDEAVWEPVTILVQQGFLAGAIEADMARTPASL